MVMRALLSLILLTLCPWASAEWRELAEHRDGDLSMTSYFEPASLIRSRKPKISVLVIFSRPAPQFSWRATKFLWEANCRSKQVRLLASVDFTQMGHDILPVTTDPYVEWISPDDGTSKTEVYRLLCGDF